MNNSFKGNEYIEDYIEGELNAVWETLKERFLEEITKMKDTEYQDDIENLTNWIGKHFKIYAKFQQEFFTSVRRLFPKGLKGGGFLDEEGNHDVLLEIDSENIVKVGNPLSLHLPFYVSIYLQPRYASHGDSGFYRFKYELFYTQNHALPYVRQIGKPSIITKKKEESIKRSADAHRERLQKIVSGGLPSLGKKR